MSGTPGAPPFPWSRWRAHVPLLVVLAAIIVATVSLATGSSRPGWAAAGVTVTPTTPLTGLVDGQRVTINVKADAATAVFGIEIRECRLDTTYTERADVLPSGGKCPQGKVSSSSDGTVVRTSSGGINAVAHSDAGATIPYLVGSGVVEWQPAADGPTSNVTCDETHPCALVVQLSVTGAQNFVVFKLEFGSADPLAGCGGQAKGILSTAGSDSMTEAWAALSRGACAQPGAAGAPSRAVFSGEGLAVQSFMNGDADLAYTAAGYDADVGLAPGSDPASRRPGVATPIALNATVVAVGGGYRQETGDKAPYPPLEVKASELAALFGGGVPHVIRGDLPYRAGIVGRNPTLSDGVLFATVPINRPEVPSETGSATWFITNYFTRMSPGDWIAPHDGDAPRGATRELHHRDPGLQ